MKDTQVKNTLFNEKIEHLGTGSVKKKKWSNQKQRKNDLKSANINLQNRPIMNLKTLT